MARDNPTMTSWRKSICLEKPLRGVAPVQPGVRLAAPQVVPRTFTESEREAARREGYEAGRADAERTQNERAAKSRVETGKAIDDVLESLRKTVPQVVRETERHLIELALDIARKLVSDLPITAEMVESVVREALIEVEGASEIHVRLHPEDLELLKSSDSKLLSPSGDGTQVRFHVASEVTRAGCLVQTRFGVIDARRETKLELLEKALLE